MATVDSAGLAHAKKLLLEYLEDRIAPAIANDAARAAPVDTGQLSRSLEVERTGDIVNVGAKTPYAGYVEMGTRNMKAQPYLRPAAYQHRGA